MKKIIILGNCGAGKSTFAKKLASLTNIPLYHLDKLCWKPHWVMSSKKEQIEVQHRLMEEEEWIIDGNYHSTLDIRLQKADTIFYLDMPRVYCVMQVLKRILVNYGKTRDDMQENCEERFSWEFIKYVWNYPKHRGIKTQEALISVAQEKEVYIFTSRKQLNTYLLNLKE